MTDFTNLNVKQVVFDPSFADARPTSTYGWFLGMQFLKSIKGLEYLNTSEVTRMDDMFHACSQLTSIDVSHFNTEKVTFMAGMFSLCRNLKILDLSSFNTSNVVAMRFMFAYCGELETIYVGDGWSTAAATENCYQMFQDCNSLVGGQGTTYDNDHVGADYAHIDGGPDNPGYFTEKSAYIRGDVDSDGKVDINDVTALIDLLLGGGTISNPAADCDKNGNIDINDVTALIDYLLIGTWN